MSLNVKEAEGRAKEALIGIELEQKGVRLVDLQMPRDFLALADLARRLARAYHSLAKSKYEITRGFDEGFWPLLTEARDHGLLEEE